MKQKQSGFAHLALLVIIVAVVLVASVSLYISRSNKSKTLTSAKPSLETTLPTDLLSISDVKELAAKDASGVALTSVELETEEGTFIYKVKLANGTVLFFNAKTGSKLTRDAGENEAEDGTIPADFVAGISFDKAREIAMNAKSGGVIRKIELESEEGKMVYSVRFTDDARIDVDASNGTIVRTKPAASSSTPTSGSSSNSGSGSSNSGSGSSSGSDDSINETESSHGGSDSGSGSGSGSSGRHSSSDH